MPLKLQMREKACLHLSSSDLPLKLQMREKAACIKLELISSSELLLKHLNKLKQGVSVIEKVINHPLVISHFFSSLPFNPRCTSFIHNS